MCNYLKHCDDYNGGGGGGGGGSGGGDDDNEDDTMKFFLCSPIFGIVLLLLEVHRTSPVRPTLNRAALKVNMNTDKMIVTGPNRSTQEKPVPLPFCPPQISHELVRAHTQVSYQQYTQIQFRPHREHSQPALCASR